MAEPITLTTFSPPTTFKDADTEATGKIIDTAIVNLDGESKSSTDASQPKTEWGGLLTTFSPKISIKDGDSETTVKINDTGIAGLDAESKNSADAGQPNADADRGGEFPTNTNVTGTKTTDKIIDTKVVKLDGDLQSNNNIGASQPQPDAQKVTICNSLPRETAVDIPKLSTFGHPTSTTLEKRDTLADSETKEQAPTTGLTAEVSATPTADDAPSKADNAEKTTSLSDVTTTKSEHDQPLKSDEVTDKDDYTEKEQGDNTSHEINLEVHPDVVVLRDESVRSNSLPTAVNLRSYSTDLGAMFVDPKERNTNRTQRNVLCAMAIATVSLILVAVGLVLLAKAVDLSRILGSRAGGTTKTSARIIGEVKINGLTFSDQYNDRSSETYRSLERGFVKLVDDFFNGSNYNNIYSNTRVFQIRNGSVVVDFVVSLKPLAKPKPAMGENDYESAQTYLEKSFKSITINASRYDISVIVLRLYLGSTITVKRPYDPESTSRTPPMSTTVPHLTTSPTTRRQETSPTEHSTSGTSITDQLQMNKPTTMTSVGLDTSTNTSSTTQLPTTQPSTIEANTSQDVPQSTEGDIGTQPITVTQPIVLSTSDNGTEAMATQLPTNQTSTTIIYKSSEMPQSDQPTSQPSTNAPLETTTAERRKKRSTGSRSTTSQKFLTSGSQSDKKTSPATQLSTNPSPTTLSNTSTTFRHSTKISTSSGSQPTTGPISVTSSSQSAANMMPTTSQLHPTQQSTTVTRRPTTSAQRSTINRRSTNWAEITDSTLTSTNQSVDKHTQMSTQISTKPLTTENNLATNTNKQSLTTSLNIAFTSPLNPDTQDQTSVSQATLQVRGSTTEQKLSTRMISDGPSITKLYTLQPAAETPILTDEVIEGCFPNPLEICLSRSYSRNTTRTPNVLGFGNNTSQIWRLFAEVTRDLSAEPLRVNSTLRVICSLLAPPCEGSQLGSSLPCRSACAEAVRTLEDSPEIRKLDAVCNESLPESESEDICFRASSANNDYDDSLSARLCHSGFCLNGGSCFVMYNRAFCRCPTSFGGVHCQIDPCLPNPCQNGATCMSHTYFVVSYACGCPEGVHGVHCELSSEDPVVLVTQSPPQMAPIGVRQCGDILPYNTSIADTDGVLNWRLVEPLASCSDQAQLLFCAVVHREFQPPDEGALHPQMRTPCRSLCEVVFSECRPLFAILGRDSPGVCQNFGTVPTDVDNFCTYELGTVAPNKTET